MPMMNLEGVTSMISRLHTKCYELDIFGLPCLRMPNNMSSGVITVSELENLIKPMK